ncbi:SH3 and multiple ankyrin repeat domains protein 3-like [Ictidomys tridecemlineatus]|nr:SH3 and multiple ankyrin repeat domains protein 3-like [Ictidomys tridecemlineatus]
MSGVPGAGYGCISSGGWTREVGPPESLLGFDPGQQRLLSRVIGVPLATAGHSFNRPGFQRVLTQDDGPRAARVFGAHLVGAARSLAAVGAHSPKGEEVDKPGFEAASTSAAFRYKKRVYKQPEVDEKQLAKLHTKTNLKKFMDHTQHRAVEKLAKLLDRGLDPNFHDLETGETPLTLAAQLDGSTEVIKALRNGGAHLDFRARDGMTALHKAARTRNQAALKTLLELGASPDYKDSYGLTPLYHTAIVGGDPYCCELLLHEHASVCCRDENGWQEIHQACRYGHVQQLEHLLFYGADMGAQNASGNTALHICALYNQEHEVPGPRVVRVDPTPCSPAVEVGGSSWRSRSPSAGAVLEAWAPCQSSASSSQSAAVIPGSR